MFVGDASLPCVRFVGCNAADFQFSSLFPCIFWGKSPTRCERFLQEKNLFSLGVKSHFKIKFYLEDLVFMFFINQQLRETTFQEQAKVKVIRTQSVQI